jgi:hypothetical protein
MRSEYVTYARTWGSRCPGGKDGLTSCGDPLSEYDDPVRMACE